VAVEVGAGWAPWLVSCGTAARRMKRIKSIHLTAIEADPKHFEMLKLHLADNGFGSAEKKLIRAVAGPKRGFAIFPISAASEQDWGIQPTYCSSEAEADALTVKGAFIDYRGRRFNKVEKMPSVALSEILLPQRTVDLVHIDIQGGERSFVESQIELLTKKVRYLVIGTHSRANEGALINVLSVAGWRLELEKPCEFAIGDQSLQVTNDGTQGWLNKTLANG
jgi:FkbM family methyltransferase